MNLCFASRIALHHFFNLEFSNPLKVRNVHEELTTGKVVENFSSRVEQVKLSPAAKKSCHPSVRLTWCQQTPHTTADPNMSTLVLEGELDSVRVVLCGTVLVDKEDRDEEDAVVECSDGRRFI